MGSETATLPAWRRALARFVIGFDVVDFQRRREVEASEIRSALEGLRNASAHLAALQTEYDRLKSAGIHAITADRLSALERQVADPANSSPFTATTPPSDHVLEWIRNAEKHMAALQGGYDRLESLLTRHTDQLMRAIARLALLDSRMADLERADTAIAAALGKDSPGRLE
jgi:hypothetical protein